MSFYENPSKKSSTEIKSNNLKSNWLIKTKKHLSILNYNKVQKVFCKVVNAIMYVTLLQKLCQTTLKLKNLTFLVLKNLVSFFSSN